MFSVWFLPQTFTHSSGLPIQALKKEQKNLSFFLLDIPSSRGLKYFAIETFASFFFSFSFRSILPQSLLLLLQAPPVSIAAAAVAWIQKEVFE